MSKRKNVIRIGDKVKIINPEVFVRAGYPLTKDVVKEKVITTEQRSFIWKLIGFDGFFEEEHLRERTFEKILDELSYFELAKRKFGGNERKIYTESINKYSGITAEVCGKRVVKTGRRVRTDDYCTYLSDEESHIILTVHSINQVEGTFYAVFDIEAKNVEKVVALS